MCIGGGVPQTTRTFPKASEWYHKVMLTASLARCGHMAVVGKNIELSDALDYTEIKYFFAKENGKFMPLDEFRTRLDTIDTQILTWLSERAHIIRQVAEVKRQHDLPVYIPEREASIIARLRTINPGPLSGETIERIYRTILEEMRQFESEHTIPSSAP
jgi:chorismate mutase-like protein